MDIEQRAARHAALGDPTRLAIVDDLVLSDRSPTELAARHQLPSNLLAHHLGVLDAAGLTERLTSSGDRRRRYVRLRPGAFPNWAQRVPQPDGPILFVCTHNSARSQMAAALWSEQVQQPAWSAGTHPSDHVHRGAVEAAQRAGLDLGDARPRRLDQVPGTPALVVTVCDRAHEELDPPASWRHWSVPDPAEAEDPAAFDRALSELRQRIDTWRG